MNPAQAAGRASASAAWTTSPSPARAGFIFRVGEALFAGFVVRQEGEVRGWIDRCPHAGMPLALMPDRYLTREGDLILCASHGALFRPLDGVCVAGPCAGRALRPWPVRIEGRGGPDGLGSRLGGEGRTASTRDSAASLTSSPPFSGVARPGSEPMRPSAKRARKSAASRIGPVGAICGA